MRAPPTSSALTCSRSASTTATSSRVASPAVVLAAIAGGRTLAEGDVLTRAGEITREFYDVMRGSLGGYEE